MKTVLSLLLLLLSTFIWPSNGSITHRRQPDILKLQSDDRTDFFSSHGSLRELRSTPTKSLPFPLNDTNNAANIYYSGTDQRVIFIVTYRVSQGVVTSSNLYRSTNYGDTFTRINTRLEPSGSIRLYPFIHVNPSDRTQLFIPHESSAFIYISYDEGVSFSKRTFSFSGINPRSLTYHPTQWQWFMAHDPTAEKLYVTQNLGQSFTKLSDNVNSTHEYQWGTAPYDTDSSMVYYNTDDPQDLTSEVQLYTQRAPYTASTKVVFDNTFGVHDDFLMVDRYIFAQKTVNGAAQLYVSYDRKSFQLAHIPSNLAHQNYLVDSLKAMQALVIVQHTNGQLNLYLSEETGLYFSLSLPDIVFENGVIDLEIVDSMNGTTYISNQYIYINTAGSSNSKRTLISFDAGGNWEMLRPPTADTTGKLLQCILPSCSLHLHMSSSAYWRTGVYSRSSAPGIIIAHGVTGAVLNDSNVNLFISRDGGVTWNMTLQSTWGVSVLDYGGLIVAARDYHQGASIYSRSLMYSCNEGRSWTSYAFTTVNTIVWGVITEPGQATTVVSLYGTQSGKAGWVVVKVNFTQVFTSTCRASDYYTWTPYDVNSDTGCLLGASVGIQRRNPYTCCLSGASYNREISYSLCQCYEEDFECDYGYMHANGITGPCVRDETVHLPDPCAGTGVSTYLKSQGYRKIGGDVCTGGVESQYSKVQTPCCLSGNSINPSGSSTASQHTSSTTTSIHTSMSTASRPSTTSIMILPRSSTHVVIAHSSSPTRGVHSTSISSTGIGSSSALIGTPGAVTGGASERSVAIILGVVLVIALLTIFVMFIVIIVVVIKVFKFSNRNGGNGGQYTRVPMTSTADDSERMTFRNFQEREDDDDEGPLPL